MKLLFEWLKVFPDKDDFEMFVITLDALMKSSIDLAQCPQSYENRHDFIIKIMSFVSENKKAIDYINSIVEISIKQGESDEGN